MNRLLWITILTVGCADGPPEQSEVTSAELHGESCVPAACSANQCGMVPDGCRSEMWCGDCACPSDAMSCELGVATVFDIPLTAGQTVTLTTTNLVPPTADPVIHVLDANGLEIAFDDDSAGANNATVTVTPGTGARLVIRSKTSTTGGVTTLLTNGVPRLLAFGGTQRTLTSLRANERVQLVRRLGPTTETVAIYPMAADGIHLAGRHTANAAGGGAVFTQPTTVSERRFLLGARNTTSTPAHVVRNDSALHDADLDGLGDELEAAIGTCRHATDIAKNFDCTIASDPRDTDGDGLRDNEELLGVFAAGAADVPLRLFGADPRHKDMFVEIDASQLAPGDPALKLTPADARRFSDYYGDRTRDLSPFTALLHAAYLKNPDQRPGIRTHLDIGVAPQNPEDALLYGDWGGWSIVPPAAGGGGQKAMTAMSTYLATERRGYFRYGLWYAGIGGQNATNVYAWSSGSEIDTFTHESVHANGLAHSGRPGPNGGVDPQCKANYPSIVNYAFQGAGLGLSDGSGLSTLNNISVREAGAVNPPTRAILDILHDDFQYLVDFATGDVDWNRDGQFTPATSRVKAYTNFQPGNSCEYTRYQARHLDSSLNTELSPALGRFGSTTYVFSPGTSRVRYTTTTSTLACADLTQPCGTWSATQTLDMDATKGVDAVRVTSSRGTPALLVVAAGADGRLFAMRRETGVFGIPVWTAKQQIPVLALSASEPALAPLPGGGALLVFRSTTGRIVQVTFDRDWVRSGIAVDATGAQIVPSTLASPGLANAAFTGHGEAVYGLFAIDKLGAQAVLTLLRFDPVGFRWVDPQIPFDDTNAFWQSVTGRPVGVWVPSTEIAQGGRLYILSTSKDGNTDGTGRFLVMRWSYVSNTNEFRIGQPSGYSTGWSYARGVDAWFDPSFDGNLRVVWPLSPLTSPSLASRIQFDPRGDGLLDFPLVNENDWPLVGFAVCRNLMSVVPSWAQVNCGSPP